MGELAVLIPIIISLGAFAMILGIKHYENKERMNMIDKGMNPHTEKVTDKSKNLRHGFLFLGVGFGLLLAKFLAEFVFTDSDGLMLYFALGFLFGGLGLVLAHNKESKQNQQQ